MRKARWRRWKSPVFVALNVKFRQAGFSQLMIWVKISIFWDIAPCSPLKFNRRFRRTSKLNTALLLLRSCLLLLERVYIAVTQKRPWYIRPSRGRFIATALYTTIHTHALGEEHRLRVFENRVRRRIFVPKRDVVTGGWRKLHNEELHNLYSSPSTIRMIKSRRM
jgi:hypothetical protein